MKEQNGQPTIRRRLGAFLKPEHRGRQQRDEFRFFKRHGCTQYEQSAAQIKLAAAYLRHEAAVDANNDHIGILSVLRRKAPCVEEAA